MTCQATVMLSRNVYQTPLVKHFVLYRGAVFSGFKAAFSPDKYIDGALLNFAACGIGPGHEIQGILLFIVHNDVEIKITVFIR